MFKALFPSKPRHAILVAPLALLVSCGEPAEKKGDPKPKPVSFAADIKPILQEKCVICHHSGTLLGKVNLENKKLAFSKSERGEFIVPGKPDESLLYTITLAPHGKRELPPGVEKPMPLMAPDLTQTEKDLLKRWIEEGAEWPEGAEGSIKVVAPPAGS